MMIYTRTQAFKHFGMKLRNVRWSWSARSPESVTVTHWFDQFKRRNGRLIYRNHLTAGDTRPGCRELIENLKWALDRCGGLLNVVIAVAKDPTAEPRVIKECFPSRLVMRLTKVDLQTGSYEAEALGPAK